MNISPQLVQSVQGRLLVVFDGECGLCNRSIRWMLRRDTNDRLRFAPSSAPAIAELLARRQVPAASPDTILVFSQVDGANERMYVRSDAILACLRQLSQPWPTLAATISLVPGPLRDLVYRFVARIRYRIWGRYDFCPLPTPEEQRHFV
jgi:predicted DCC family thiol-disulfide oxidoreductase YuxK